MNRLTNFVLLLRDVFVVCWIVPVIYLLFKNDNTLIEAVWEALVDFGRQFCSVAAVQLTLKGVLRVWLAAESLGVAWVIVGALLLGGAAWKSAKDISNGTDFTEEATGRSSYVSRNQAKKARKLLKISERLEIPRRKVRKKKQGLPEFEKRGVEIKKEMERQNQAIEEWRQAIRYNYYMVLRLRLAMMWEEIEALKAETCARRRGKAEQQRRALEKQAVQKQLKVMNVESCEDSLSRNGVELMCNEQFDQSSHAADDEPQFETQEILDGCHGMGMTLCALRRNEPTKLRKKNTKTGRQETLQFPLGVEQARDIKVDKYRFDPFDTG